MLSELRKPRPSRNVAAFVADQPGELFFVSEVTFAEIRYGIELLSEGPRRADLNLWLDRVLRPLFDRRVLAVTEDVIVRWRWIVEEGRRRGHTFSQPDLFIAAIAAQENLVVVSRDVSEFIAAGVPVFDPWQKKLYAGNRSNTVGSPASLDAVRALIAGRH